MWTEWVTAENIDNRVWPRTAAIAERLWSPEGIQDIGSMYARLSEVSWRLEWLGLTHRSGEFQMLHRMAGTDDISALRTLADVVEPVKDYTRISNVNGPWDFRAPLNRLVDAVSPESDRARRFGDLVARYIQSRYKDQAAAGEIRILLTAWRGNDDKLRPLLEHSFLLRAIAPLSQDLAALGESGLRALDYLEKSESSPESWRDQQLARFESAREAKADLLLVLIAPVERLIEASAGELHNLH
jgi:hexosaminidase